MKLRIVLAIALMLGIGITFGNAPRVSAQASPDAKAEAAKKLEALAKQLNLTADQKQKLLPVLAEEAPKLKAIKEDTSLTGMQKLQKLRAIHQETDPKVKEILTAEQYQQWETYRQQEIHEMIERKRAGN